MKAWRFSLSVLLAATLLTNGGARAGGGLSADEARAVLRRWVGPNSAVQIKEVSPLGSSTLVVANIETAFRFAKDEEGHWRVAEIRRGDNKWEDARLLEQALQREKTERARAELELFAQALDSFKQERGFYVSAQTAAGLTDHLCPRYLKRIIRVDPWQQPYEYETDGAAYTLRSRGADGKKATPDDIIARP